MAGSYHMLCYGRVVWVRPPSYAAHSKRFAQAETLQFTVGFTNFDYVEARNRHSVA